MIINEEVLEEMQGTIIETLIAINSYSEEDAIRCLEDLKLDHESATELLLAYRESQNAESTAKNVWDTIVKSEVEADHSNVAGYHQKEFETRRCFERIKEKCALRIVINRIEPSEINEEILKNIYEKGIRANQITKNPELQLHVHYYTQIAQIYEKAERSSAGYQRRNDDLTKQLEDAKAQNEKLRDFNKSWQIAYKNLEQEFEERMDSDEKNYQAALAQIETLKQQLEQSQKRGVWDVIKHKLKGRFGDKTKKLPETTQEIPKTLFPEDFGDETEEMEIQQENEKNETIDSKTDVEVSNKVDDRDDGR